MGLIYGFSEISKSAGPPDEVMSLLEQYLKCPVRNFVRKKETCMNIECNLDTCKNSLVFRVSQVLVH